MYWTNSSETLPKDNHDNDQDQDVDNLHQPSRFFWEARGTIVDFDQELIQGNRRFWTHYATAALNCI